MLYLNINSQKDTVIIMRFKKRFPGLLVFTFLTLKLFDAHAQTALSYTQYMDNPTPINPAYSLTNDYQSVSFTAHKQWIGIPGSPTLFFFNTDFPLIIDGAKAGIVASDNSVAVERVTKLNGFFAKAIQLSETQKLGISISAGLRYYSTAYAPLDYKDPAIQNDQTELKPNIGISAILFGDDYYVGISMPEFNFRNLNSTVLSDNNIFRNHYFLSGGLTSVLDDDFALKPAALVSYTRGIPLNVDISTKLSIKDTFGIGVNYNNSNDVSALFSIDSDLFHLGYSYQFGVSSSSLGKLSNASHELTLTFLFGKSNKVSINPGNR